MKKVYPWSIYTGRASETLARAIEFFSATVNAQPNMCEYIAMRTYAGDFANWCIENGHTDLTKMEDLLEEFDQVHLK